MAGSRTLKLSILADVDNLRKSLNEGTQEVSGFGDKMLDFGKKVAAAFAFREVAQFTAEMVKNAAEDEAAQRKLALTLQNTSNATRDQIDAVEKYITKISLAKGVTDDQLRPAIERLNRSTKDISQSQEILNLALDITSGTGKPLEAVVNALGKAYDGNATSLGRLGLGVDSAILKSKDFDKITAALRENFKGFSDQEANTFEGKLRRLQIAFDEGKETIGSYILTAITPLVEVVVNRIIPAISDFTDNLGKGLSPTIKIFKPVLEGLTSAFNDIRDSFQENSDKLQPFFNLLKAVGSFMIDKLAPIIGTLVGTYFKLLGKEIGFIIDQFANLVDFLSKVYDKIKSIIDFLKNNPVTKFFTGASFETGTPTTAAPTVTAPQYVYANSASAGTVINISGAIDPESTARQINDILTQSAARGGGATNLVYA